MVGQVLRRAANSWLVLGLLAILFACGFAGSTFGYFDATVDQGAVSLQGGYVAAATSQTATASGYDGVVTWALPDTTGVQGQQILMQDNGASTDCSSVTYGSTIATLTPSATSYTDSNRSASTGAGDQFCYAVRTYWTTNSWDHVARAPATQLGLVIDSIQITNSGTANKVTTGDRIILTFNQKPAAPANGTICTYGTGEVIYIGDATCGNINTDPWVIGKLTGYSVGGVGHQKRSATVTVSSAAPWTMTIQLTQTGQNVTGSGTFTPSSSLVSAATTDQATVCQSGSACLPSISGSF
jgi:hypothetical protein